MATTIPITPVPPTMCNTRDTLIGHEETLDVSQVRTALLDATDALGELRAGFALLTDCPSPASARFVARSIEAQVDQVVENLTIVSASEWRRA